MKVAEVIQKNRKQKIARMPFVIQSVLPMHHLIHTAS